jgi:hypothetical protein
MRAFAALPLGTTLLSLLPEPMVLGIDYQMAWAGKTQNGTFLDQRGNHWAYYPMTVLLKTPLPVLLLAVGGALAARAMPRSRGLWTCALLPPLLLLAYCSLTRSLQMGVRYVMPVVPALSMLAGGALGHAWAATRAGRLAVGALALWCLANVVLGWPHFVGFFNAFAGGSTNGYRVCADGNLDWNQRRETGEAALRSRHPALHVLQPGEGPRFARVAAYAEELKADDPRTPGRLYHWLDRFRPIDHDGPAWLVYDVTPEAFARAVAAGDHRAAEDLCLAHLARDDFAAARAALALVPAASRGEAHAGTAGLVERMAAAGGDAAQRDHAAQQLMAAGHFELALAWTDRTKRENAVRTALLMTLVGRQRDGVAFLEAAGADGSRTTTEVILLARSLVDGGRNYAPDPMHALELMRRGPAPAPESPHHGEWQALEAQVQQAIERERRVAGDR